MLDRETAEQVLTINTAFAATKAAKVARRQATRNKAHRVILTQAEQLDNTRFLRMRVRRYESLRR